jgi:hypothetical protein
MNETLTLQHKEVGFFKFPIVNFPFICSNIPAEPPIYGVYHSVDDTIETRTCNYKFLS